MNEANEYYRVWEEIIDKIEKYGILTEEYAKDLSLKLKTDMMINFITKPHFLRGMSDYEYANYLENKLEVALAIAVSRYKLEDKKLSVKKYEAATEFFRMITEIIKKMERPN